MRQLQSRRHWPSFAGKNPEGFGKASSGGGRNSMRAYRLSQPTGIDALVKVDLPMPKPGARQVLIKVAACSLNYRDLAIALGSYRMPTKPDLVPLSDGAGEVVELGAGVKN